MNNSLLCDMIMYISIGMVCR